MNIQTIRNEIIDLAISKENEAIELFTKMASSSRNPATKALFNRLVKMEKGHKLKLEKLDRTRLESQQINPKEDLSVADYNSRLELNPDSSYKEVLLYAIQKEKSAIALYTDLAWIYISVPEVKKFFEFLAQEETFHKKELEREFAKLDTVKSTP